MFSNDVYLRNLTYVQFFRKIYLFLWNLIILKII